MLIIHCKSIFLKLIILSFSLFHVQLIRAQENGQTDTLKIKELLSTSTKLQRTNQDSSYALAQDAYKLSEQIHFEKGIGGALIRIGSILYTNGRLDTSLQIIQRALAIRVKLNDFKGASGACILLSYIYDSKGKRDSAFYSLYEALRFNKAAKDSVNMVQTYVMLGNLSNEYGENQKAVESYENAAKLSIAMNYLEGVLLASDGLANYYFKTNNFKKALSYYLICDSAAKATGDIISYSQNLNNLALCYQNLNDNARAIIYFKQGIENCIREGLNDELSRGYSNLSEVYIKLKKPDSAIYLLNLALPLSRSVGILNTTAECYERLARAHALKGSYFEAYSNQVSFSALSDSLINNEKVKKIAEMQTKYETEKKESEIVLLNVQNKTKLVERNFFIAGTILFLLLAGAIFMGLVKTRKEKRKTEALLLNILPSEVANELKRTGASEAKQYNHVTVLFTDFVNFTGISEQMSPTELVKEINRNFTAFDAIIEKHGLEKIKTIGDAYLAVCGLPNETRNHAEKVINAALELQQYMDKSNGKFQLRIGIHSGAVVAGIVGVKKFAYDIWGDTVNTASRMESSSSAGKINVSEATYQLTSDKFIFTSRGKIEAKHKGFIDMYFVDGIR